MDYKRIFLNIGICTTMGCAFPLFVQAATATQVVAKSPQTIMIKDLISKIEKESGYLFYYSKSNVNVNRTVTINKDNKNVKNLLDDAFNGTSIRYVIKGKNIVLTENRDTKSEEAEATAHQRFEHSDAHHRCLVTSAIFITKALH